MAAPTVTPQILAYAAEVAAGTKAEIEIDVPTPGKYFRIYRILLHFPVGTEYNLQVKIRYGALTIVPRKGTITGDDSWFDLDVSWFYSRSGDVVIEVENVGASSHKLAAYVYVEEVR